LGVADGDFEELQAEMEADMIRPAFDWSPVTARWGAADQSTSPSSGWPNAGSKPPVAGTSRDRWRSKDQLPDQEEIRDRRWGRDNVETENEGEQPISYLIEGGPEAWAELQHEDPEIFDRIAKWASDKRKRGAKDEPPPFSGRPRPGGGMDPIDQECGASEAYDSLRLLERARQGGRAGDVDVLNARRSPHRLAADERLPAGQSFGEMFPATKRVRIGGFG
jgi:hypothetical protein